MSIRIYVAVFDVVDSIFEILAKIMLECLCHTYAVYPKTETATGGSGNDSKDWYRLLFKNGIFEVNLLPV